MNGERVIRAGVKHCLDMILNFMILDPHVATKTVVSMIRYRRDYKSLPEAPADSDEMAEQQRRSIDM